MRIALASFGFLALATAAAAVPVVAACSSTTEEQPTPVSPVPTTEPTADGAPPAADAGTETGAECLGSEGCYKCEVQNLAEALNACTESQCAQFDNAARLPLFNGGALPPVP